MNPNNVNFGDYDFVKNKINLNSKLINSNYIFNPQKIWLSSNLQFTGLYNRNSNFNGTMERFLALSPSVTLSDVFLMNSGCVCDYYSGGYVSVSNGYSGVTGYGTELVAYFSGITGTSYLPTGVIEDSFGNSYTGYQQIDMTGVLYEENSFPLYGLTYIQTEEKVDDYIVLNSGLIYNYGKSKINLISKVDINDNINYVYNTGINDIYNIYNLYSPKINNFNYFGWILDDKRNNYTVSSNGLCQYSGKYIQSGNIYNIENIISGDYLLDNNGNIFFNNSFGYRDNVMVDIIHPDLYESFVIDNFSLDNINLTNSGNGIYYLNWPKNCELFLNGQKLVSGNHEDIGTNADYGITGGGIYFINTGVFYNINNSILTAIVNNINTCDDVTNQNILNAKGKFLGNSSRIYKNGVRLDEYYDYIELGDFDTNLGTGIFDIKENIIYNGNGGFH
jgi:hypothetical protein